ncbi:flotillin family protein [Zhihengliuella salsuginis]|uniref:Flotillin n=1 Tax=Zhihengliuella salsuginis TaxID=578222 RepID=A0ABQ3GAH2_9MICC|nr:SPFH domain-containing protein [Zhihengliuella salsuginis]GHC99786.1 flotillin [Zhihengliuella salsuginis]
MELTFLGGFILVVALIALLVGFIMFRKAYRVAAPNEALVITGRAPARVKGGDIDLESGTRIVVGSRAFVRPLFDRAHSISLSSRQINVEVESQSVDGIFLRLQAVAQVKIGEEVDEIRKAAQRFLDQQDKIDSYSQEILSGALRAVVGTLTVTAVLQDRTTFAQKVQENAVDSMNNQGLVIDTLQIISVADDGDYLKNLGRPEASKKEQEARIAESEARRTSTEAENRDSQKIADSQKELDLRNATIAKETAEQRAEAEAAEELARSRQRQEVLDEQQKIAEQENDLRERELVREIRKPADAEEYAAGRKADAERYAREQESKAALIEAQNEAESVRARGVADADATRAKGEAEAASIQANAEAYKQFNEAAVLSQVLEALPGIAREIAAPMSNIDSLSIVSSDGESKLSQNVSAGMARTMESVQSATGLDIKSLIESALGGKDQSDVVTNLAPQSEPESASEAADAVDGKPVE